MADIAFFVGALVPTFLISRLGLWLTRQWPGGNTRLITVHGVSLLLTAFVGGIGMADGGAFAGAEAAMGYALPQAIWLIVDLVRFTRRHPASEPQATAQVDRPHGAHNQIMWFAVAVVGVILVSAVIVQLGTQPPASQNPWEHSWETEYVAPAEAPAEPALPAGQEAPPLHDYSDAELERIANGTTEPTQADERSGAFDDIISEAQTPPPQ